MVVNIYAATVEDSLDLAELELYHLINAYRSEHDRQSLKLSSALTITAGRHALDTVENVGQFVGHDWSDYEYHVDYPVDRSWNGSGGMWTRPADLGTGFDGIGYEISARAAIPNLGRYLELWQSSPGHNDVILQQGVWNAIDFVQIGLGIYQNVAHIWFSTSSDTTGPYGGVPLIEGDGADNRAVLTDFDDVMMAYAGNDTISAAAGDDLLFGNHGLDRLIGDAGNDTLWGGQNAGDPDKGGRGDQVIAQRQGTETLDGGAGDDMLFGNVGADLLIGGAGDDLLWGGQESDTLDGGAGADTLAGNRGDDDLTGGPGADHFLLNGGGLDVVRDFNPGEGDRLGLPGPVTATGVGDTGHLILRHESGAVELLAIAPEHWAPDDWLI